MMTNKIKYFTLITFLFFQFVARSQQDKGIVEYRAEINKTHVDSFLTALNSKKDVPMHIKQGVRQMYLESTPDDYVLTFKNHESYFYHQPNLDGDGVYNIGSKAGSNPFYFNSSKNSIVESSASLGKIAKDELNWKILKKSKIIGGFKCYKAEATEILYSRQGHYYRRKVTAWFAPEIPVSFGPQNYVGLPGLVLEVKRDEFTIRATKVILNPSKEVEVERISDKDKIITQKEANRRIKEMEESRKRGR